MRQGERQESLALLAMGHQMMATNFVCQGRFRLALESNERAMACVRSGPEQNWKLTAAGQLTESLAVCLAFASMILSVSGRLEEARRYGRNALEQARRINHPHTTALVLTYTALACQVRREVQEASRCANEAVAISSERSYWMWHGVGESHPGAGAWPSWSSRAKDWRSSGRRSPAGGAWASDSG